MKYIEENLNTHVNSRENHIDDFTFDQSKSADYTIKYLENQADRMWYDLSVKYPYFRFRGLSVDKETALDIIAKTDERFRDIHFNDKDYEYGSSLNDSLVNNWTCNTGDKGNFPFGWCHPDGTIGYNSFTIKYPDYAELLNEIINIKLDFPFLEFMVAFTSWNSEAPYVSDLEHEIREKISDEEAEIWVAKEDYFNFAENIELLIYVHDKTVEVYWDKEATPIYKELLLKLQNKPDIKYVLRYYEMFWMKEENIEPRIKAMLNEEQLRIAEEYYECLLNYVYEGCLISEEQIEKYRMYHVDACYGHLKRRPFFKVVGKPVTPEQAKEFIKMTDVILKETFELCRRDKRLRRFYNVKQCKKVLELLVLKTSIYSSNISMVRPDGIIDYGGISQSKYPDDGDFLFDMDTIADNFPYLDFVAVLTCWNEESPFEWDWDDYIEDIEAGRRTKEEVNAIMKVEDDIYRAIYTCVWVHDGKRTVLHGKAAKEKFREYTALYRNENDHMLAGECLLKMGTDKVEYFKEILDFYEIPEETLKQLRYTLTY